MQTLRTIRRIFAYAVPYMWRIVMVMALTACYTACLTLRLGLIGLLVDGVLLSDFGGSQKSVALRAYQAASEFLGADVRVASCLLYTSDAADDLPCVDLGGRRIIKKKKTITLISNSHRHIHTALISTPY